MNQLLVGQSVWFVRSKGVGQAEVRPAVVVQAVAPQQHRVVLLDTFEQIECLSFQLAEAGSEFADAKRVIGLLSFE